MPRFSVSNRRWLSVGLLLLSMCFLALASGVQPMSTYAQAEPTPRPLYAIPDARSNPVYTSNSLALAESNGLLVAVNMLTDTVALVAPAMGELRAELPVGDDPRSVAVAPDGVRALIANRGDSSLTVLDVVSQQTLQTFPLGGLWAYGVVTSSNDFAYVSMQGSAEVVKVSLSNGEILARIATPPMPTGLALWGDFLYVTHLWSGEVSLIYLPQLRVVTTLNTGIDTSLSPSIDIDPTRAIAYVPQTRNYATNDALTYDTTVLPLVNVLRLSSLALERVGRVNLDVADRPVNMPFAVKVDPFRRYLYVANAGSDNVSVIELDSGRAVAHIPVGVNPRGLLLNRDNSRLYVHNAIGSTINIINTATLSIVDGVPISTDLAVPVDVLIGAELFHTAKDARLSQGRWMSCANCHLDGMSDNRVWQGFEDGARNTPMLFNLSETAPYNWSATWDELADVELKIRSLQAGTGLIEGEVFAPLAESHAGLSLDLDTLLIYLNTLEGPQSPYDANTPQVQRGREVFLEQSCDFCHALPRGTNLRAYDVGTGGTFDTPTVRWLWLSAPYFHDGSAETLADVFRMPGAHQLSMAVPPQDIEALVAYLLTLPSDEVLTD